MTTTARTDVGLVAHLMRRAAFGAPAWQLERFAEHSYEELVEDLIAIDRHPRLEEDLLERFYIEHADEERYTWFGKRWFFRMINSERPLEEKVALMWHNRFATAASKVSHARSMGVHLEMLRDNGMGNFKDLLVKLSHDPAMIWWLDQQTNHGPAVNENYGRELLELFSMGRGNYTEVDVRSAAESFSGWTIDQTIPRYPNGWYDTNFVYRDEDHDHREKEFLGERGDFTGDEIVEIVARQPATARFVATTLYRFFVADEPDETEIDALAKSYFAGGYEISSMLRTLFLSDAFKDSRYKRVRWPAEHVANLMKLTWEHTDPYEFGLSKLHEASKLMGQELLNPPTVEGWHIGREWIDSGFLMERVNFAANRLGNLAAPGIRRMIDRLRSGRQSMTAEDLLDACLYEMGCVELRDAMREAILDELGRDVVYKCDDSFPDSAAQMFQFIASSPDFQLA